MLQITGGLAEGQVLQRGTSGTASVCLKVSGAARGPLTVTLLDSKKRKVKGWRERPVAKKNREAITVELSGIPTGGPYQLILEAVPKVRARVRSFFVGDLWVLAGQSNMQGYGLTCGAPPKHPLLRSFSMRHEWIPAAEPLHLLAESPNVCHNSGEQCTPKEADYLRRNSKKGTGPGLFFAHRMLKASGVPQGLIPAAHGGTRMEQWEPELTINGQTSLYGSMVESVRATGQPIAGVLWYQGESDTKPESVPLYTERMQKLVKQLRKDLRQPKLPWVMVQISKFFCPISPEQEQRWNLIQEQQRLLPKTIPYLGVVSSIDLAFDDQTHLAAEGHRVLGRRLAMEAERLVYGKSRKLPPPQLKSISAPFSPKAKDKHGVGGSLVVEVVYENVVGSLQAGNAPHGFALTDEKGADLRSIYKVTLHGDTVRLHLAGAGQNAKVSYGFGCTPYCNITDERGHALHAFGPQPLGELRAYLPFIKTWNVHPPMVFEQGLDQFKEPPAPNVSSEVQTYGENEFRLDGFINEHPRWVKKHGFAFFNSYLVLPEPMRLEFWMGYDGPIRIWINGKSFFTDLNGINPCFPDENNQAIALAAGKHRIDVGMDINHGQAWGFFLRMVRKDLTLAKIRSGDYAKPEYTIS